MMNGGKGAPLLPLYDREAAAGRRLREQTFQQYCFWPCGAPASHLHHSVCSTLLCLKQRCRYTVYISESKKKYTHKLCLFWRRRGVHMVPPEEKLPFKSMRYERLLLMYS